MKPFSKDTNLLHWIHRRKLNTTEQLPCCTFHQLIENRRDTNSLSPSAQLCVTDILVLSPVLWYASDIWFHLISSVENSKAKETLHFNRRDFVRAAAAAKDKEVTIHPCDWEGHVNGCRFPRGVQMPRLLLADVHWKVFDWWSSWEKQSCGSTTAREVVDRGYKESSKGLT